MCGNNNNNNNNGGFLFMALNQVVLYVFPRSADHKRDWPPCKEVFFGLATNALNVRNNKDFSLNSNNKLMYHKKGYASFHGAQGVLCCTTGNKHKILRDSSILSISLLTCVVLVPLEDRSKQAMNDDRCDYCAQYEHDDNCCFHPLQNFLAIGRRSGALPRPRRRHRTRGRTAFSVVCHVPANIQATSAVECDLWYGVRRPYFPVLHRF